MIPDFHTHSFFSSDSDADIEAMLKHAMELNMSSMCITDHYDMDFPVYLDEPELTFELDAKKYYSYMCGIKEKYAGKIDLKIGMELGFMPTTSRKLNTFTADNSHFDFFIGSLHVIDWMDPYRPEYFSDKTELQAYYHYFDTILQCAKVFTGYNVLGHLDYILRYGPSKAAGFNINDYCEIFDELFKLIIPLGKGIELNTGSLYKGLENAHPHPDILKLYKAAGGEIITLGSDAHTPDYIGYGFSDMLKLLREYGFKYVCTFEEQKPIFHKI